MSSRGVWNCRRVLRDDPPMPNSTVAITDHPRFRRMVVEQLGGASDALEMALRAYHRDGDLDQRATIRDALDEIRFCDDLLRQIGGDLADASDLLAGR